jgi:hypothetical protein
MDPEQPVSGGRDEEVWITNLGSDASRVAMNTANNYPQKVS